MAAVTPPYPKNIKLVKGSLVSVNDLTFQSKTVSFQYNPDTLSRSLQPVTLGPGDGNRSQALRFTGAAAQTISLEVQIDCMEQLNTGDPIAVAQGIYPQLAVLESLLYPSSIQVIANQALAVAGMLEVVPLTAPRTLFVWGPSRVLPVRLMSLKITEQLFDANLNPIQAAAAMELKVLTYSDVFLTNPDWWNFLSYQMKLEALAAMGGAS
jgi:hypothetical protein